MVNPNACVETTQAMVRIATETADGWATVEGVTAPHGAHLITTPAALDDAARTVAQIAPTLASADAVVVAAFGDPGLAALRTQLANPVTGLAEAGMAEAGLDGRRFAIVTTTPALRARIASAARHYGHTGFAGTWITPGDPVQLTADPPALLAALRAAMTAALRESDAEAILIGGGPLAIAARALAADAPVPLIEPIPAAIRLSLARASQRNPT